MMKVIAPHPYKKSHAPQAGNVFFMLFASIALIGAMTAGAGNIVKGLVTSMSDVTRKTIAEEKMQGAARISIQNATVTQSSNGDCDADGKVEPLPFRNPAGKPAPVGGGLVPQDVGATLKDPWGTEYGYCAWDAGSVTQNASCGSPSRRLSSIDNVTKTVIAVISAGRDRKFSTTCANITGAGGVDEGVTTAAGSDDIVMRYTYNDAQGITGDELWKVKDTKPGTATIDKDIDVTGRAEFTGPLNLLNSGLILPGDSGSYTCTAATDQQLRINFTNNPALLEICDFDGGHGWVAVSMGSGGGTTTLPADCSTMGTGGAQRYNDPVSGHCYWIEYTYLNRANAKSYCETNGGYLATITSAAEGTMIANNLNIDEHMYLSMNDIAVEGTWRYDGGELAGTQFWSGGAGGTTVGGNYARWRAGNPSNTSGTEHCAVLGNGGELDWDDANCTTARPPLCEKSPTIVPSSGATPPGLIHRWRLDETTGTTAPNTAGSNNGTLFNSPTWVPTSGVRDGALRFDTATNTYVRVGRSAALEPAAVSVSMWIKRNGPQDYIAGLLSKTYQNDGAPVYASYALAFANNSDTQLRFVIGRSGGVDSIDAGEVPDNTWTHIVATYDPAATAPQARLYQDGVLVGSLTRTAAIAYDATATGDLYMGSLTSSSTGQHFKGLMDDVMIFNRALTQQEVTDLYTASDLDYGAGGSGGSEAPVTNPVKFMVSPNNPQCTAAQTGPLMRTGISDITNTYQYIAKGKDNYFFTTGGTASGVSAFRANGDGTITRITTQNSGGGNSGGGIIADDNYIYVNNYNHNLVAFTFDGTTLTQVGSVATPSNGGGVAKHNGFVISADNTALVAYSFNGTTFAQTGTLAANGARHVWSDGTYVYYVTTSDNKLNVATFNGTAFTPVTNVTMTTSTADQMVGDGKYIYVETASAVEVYKFTGTALTLVDIIQSGTNATTSVATDGVNIYIGENNVRLSVARMEDDRITVLSTYDLSGVGGTTMDMISDSSYLYVSTVNGPIQVYSGVSCYADGSAPDGHAQTSGIPAIGKISIGFAHSCGIKRGGSVWCWGDDTFGQLGNGSISGGQVSPSRIDDSASYSQVTSGNYYSCGVRANGTGTCWGRDLNGQLGNGGAVTADQPSPYALPHKWTRISAGNGHACGISDTGQIYCWGAGANGQIGNGASVNQPDPTLINDASGQRWTHVSAGSYVTCAINLSGQLFCWGDNAVQQLGLGSRGTAVGGSNTPQPVADPGPWVSVSVGAGSVCGIKTDGSAWCWGWTRQGVLGIGSVANASYYNKPTRIADPGPWNSISVGTSPNYYTACGIKQNGMAACWGSDSSGQLGNGSATSDYSIPVSVLDPGPWSDISAGHGASCGMKLDGAAWCWGSDAGGALGNGTTYTGQQNAPTPVAKFLDIPAWIWDSNGLGITATGTANIGLGMDKGLSYDGYQSPASLSDGLVFSAAGRSYLRKYNSGSELLIDATSATGSAQLSWKANSAANTRSLGIDYTTGALEFGNNNGTVVNWMHQIAPSVEITDLGNVGIGTNASIVRTKMEVNGGLKIGNDTGSCNIMRMGIVRYSGGGNVFEYCDGAAWVGL